MKKRLAKKKAKMFLTGKVAYPVCYDYRSYSSDGDYETLLFFEVPAPILSNAYDLARSSGWGGSWYTAPEMIGTLGYESNEWKPNPCWGFAPDEIQKMSLGARRGCAYAPKYF